MASPQSLQAKSVTSSLTHKVLRPLCVIYFVRFFEFKLFILSKCSSNVCFFKSHAIGNCFEQKQHAYPIPILPRIGVAFVHWKISFKFFFVLPRISHVSHFWIFGMAPELLPKDKTYTVLIHALVYNIYISLYGCTTNPLAAAVLDKINNSDKLYSNIFSMRTYTYT